MALEGRLSEFTLEEILQLIALQQKTGVLNVDASYPMVLYFEGGELLSYRDRRGAGEDPLQAYLKRYGFFSVESWEHLEFIQRNSDLDFTEILVNEGHLSADDLTRVQHQAAQEHIFRGMQLTSGRYHFASGREVLKGVKGRVRIKVEGLLMEAARRIDEFGSLRERYPDRSVKLRRTDTEVEEELTGSMGLMLNLIGTEATLGSVVSQAKMSEFDCLQTMEALRDADLISVFHKPVVPEILLDEEEDDHEVAEPSRRVAMVWALVALIVVGAFWMVRPMSPYAEKLTDSVERSEVFLREQEREKIQAALEIYHAGKGRYPLRLQQLAEEGLLPTDFDFSSASPYQYETGGGGASYQLESES